METKNQVVQLSGGLALQNKLLTELDTANKEFGKDFSDYGKQCVINAITALVNYCSTNKIAIADLNPTQLRLTLQNVGYTELNAAAIPSECFIETRKLWVEIEDEKTKEKKNKLTYSVALRPQGAGNEKLVRKYGVGIKDLSAPFLVREGDEYTLPGFDGEKITPFKWVRKGLDSKVIMVVYRLTKLDGSTEYLIATRESVKANVVAQIRQSTMYAFTTKDSHGKDILDTEKRDAFYEELNTYAESHKIDELLTAYKKYLNPTYVSFGSKEQMLIRKMCNNALKNYPREFADTYTKLAVENMFEDVDETLNEKHIVEVESDPVKKVEEETSQPNPEGAVPDFDADGVAKEKVEMDEQPKITPSDCGPGPAPHSDDDYGF